MLFVFQVDTGKMTTFEMSLAMGSVENLKVHIERVCKIPVEEQVLLISGGQHLNAENKVSSYGAGTDTNPIFLFSKAIVKDKEPPEEEKYCGPACDMTDKVKEGLDLPAVYATVVKRAQLAQEFHDLAMAEKKFLEGLVHEQFLQNQGWMAVIANLEDLATDLTKRFAKFKNEFHIYAVQREEYLELLKNYHSDLELLRKIPVLPALLEIEKTLVPDDENVEKQENDDRPASLYDWMSTDNKILDTLFNSCRIGYDQLTNGLEVRLENEVRVTIERSATKDMKEIKGLDTRLFALDTLMTELTAHVNEQRELALSFVRNQTRAGNLREQSILPDLCATHFHQLKVLLENHNKIRNISSRIVTAKNELNMNLYYRLQWVVIMENDILELDNKLVFNFKGLLAIRDYFNILQQVHVAPGMYLTAIAEVVRRRKFSQSFLMWASELACHMLTIYNDELTRRKDFQQQFEAHFLNGLFPGMDDLPSPFATQAPSMFDSSLPPLVEDDVEKLKQLFPELAASLKVPDVTAVVNFFLSRSVIKEDDRNDHAPIEEKLIEVVKEAGVASNLDQTVLKAIDSEPPLSTPHGLPHLKDLDRGCESETDTEEFEKVGQSPFDLNFEKGLPSPKPGTQDVSTITEVGVVYAPPKKPPRAFQKSSYQDSSSFCPQITTNSTSLQRTLSTSGSQSNTESFTNIKNPSLESIDELSSLKNFGSNTESCYNSHHQQMQGYTTATTSSSSVHLLRSKSISPHTPQSPKDLIQVDSPNSPLMGHQHNDFVNDEFYIDESLPSSLSIETGQSQGEFVKQLDTANNVVALLQDNLQISRTEYEKLKSTLVRLAQIARQIYSELKNEISTIKVHFSKEKEAIVENFETLLTTWSQYITERDNKERETVQRLTVDHELEISDFRRIGQSKNEEIKMLKAQNEEFRRKLIKLSEENCALRKQMNETSYQHEKIIEEHKKQLEDAQLDKDKSIKEVTDRLKLEHRGELENIRARFKLMTMERSPSENSLEKIERSDLSSLTNHEALLLQMTENFESEKEVAVSDAIVRETERWQQKLDSVVDEMKKKFVEEKEKIMEDVEKRIVEDKDKQIDVLREQMRNMSLELLKYKGTIQQLTEHREDNLNLESQKVQQLQRKIAMLEEDLERTSNSSEKPTDMAASVAVCEGKVDAITSPIKVKRRSDSARFEKFSFQGCRQGDLVLIVWDTSYKNFRVLQDSSSMYFLHSDSLENLGLEIKDEQPNRSYCYAEVVDKEYCHARKDEYSSFDFQSINRFKVPKGTKFFRVRCKPSIIREHPMPSPIPSLTPPMQQSSIVTAIASTTTSFLQQSQMSQSLTKASASSTTTSSTEIVEGPSQSLPSSPLKLQHCWGDDKELSTTTTTTHCDIPEEKGEDTSIVADQTLTDDVVCQQQEEDIEKGTELTENYQIQASIDR